MDRLINSKTEYTQQGEGRDVVFLHGWGGSLDSFAYFAKAAAGQGYRALNICFAGHGGSDPPDGIWGIADYCGRLIKLLGSLDITKATFVGHSFGGRAAIWLAANRPELVDKIVLVDSAGIPPKRGLRYTYKVWRYKKRKKRGADVSKFGSADYQKINCPYTRATFINIVNEDLSPFLPLIAAPALLVWGARDKDTPMYMAKKLLKGIKDSGLVKIERAGHWSYVDDPNKFLAVLFSFLEA